VLLYKSKAPRPKDEADLALALPRLDNEARVWLAEAIARFEPASPWRARF
jgi:alpha-D-ribose 1-methylphosphonate 5-triphosphate synthase subunit PhnH